MAVICITGIPSHWNHRMLFKFLTHALKGKFEVLNFTPTKTKTKICYINVPHKINTQKAIQRILNTPVKAGVSICATISNYQANEHDKSKKALPKKTKKKSAKPGEMLLTAHFEIKSEMHYKYPKFHEINMKTNSQLLEKIARVIFKRLKIIMLNNEIAGQSCFNLTRFYRKVHPHFGDFQLILSTLHEIQDAAGEPRSQITEEDLLPDSEQLTKSQQFDVVPDERVHRSCVRYSDKIIKSVSEHVNNLDSEVLEGDDEEEVARKQVRDALKKMTPYMPMIIKQVVSNHFIPDTKIPTIKYRMYGEPYLPNKDTTMPFLKKHHATAVARSDQMYNLMRFNLRPMHCDALMKLDGSNLSGAKLVIRPSDCPRGTISSELQNEIRTTFNTPSEEVEMEEEIW